MPTGGHEENTEEEEEPEASALAESTALAQPHPPRPQSTSFHLASQIPNLATKSKIAHLHPFMVEQFHYLRATIMSKLESMDSRLQACEAYLTNSTQAPSIPHPQPPQDPKGKAPMVSPHPSPIPSPISSPSHQTSPAPTPHIPSPLSTTVPKPPSHDPIAIPSQSSSSSTSSSSSSSNLQEF